MWPKFYHAKWTIVCRYAQTTAPFNCFISQVDMFIQTRAEANQSAVLGENNIEATAYTSRSRQGTVSTPENNPTSASHDDEVAYKKLRLSWCHEHLTTQSGTVTCNKSQNSVRRIQTTTAYRGWTRASLNIYTRGETADCGDHESMRQPCHCMEKRGQHLLLFTRTVQYLLPPSNIYIYRTIHSTTVQYLLLLYLWRPHFRHFASAGLFYILELVKRSRK